MDNRAREGEVEAVCRFGWQGLRPTLGVPPQAQMEGL